MKASIIVASGRARHNNGIERVETEPRKPRIYLLSWTYYNIHLVSLV